MTPSTRRCLTPRHCPLTSSATATTSGTTGRSRLSSCAARPSSRARALARHPDRAPTLTRPDLFFAWVSKLLACVRHCEVAHVIKSWGDRGTGEKKPVYTNRIYFGSFAQGPRGKGPHVPCMCHDEMSINIRKIAPSVSQSVSQVYIFCAVWDRGGLHTCVTDIT